MHRLDLTTSPVLAEALGREIGRRLVKAAGTPEPAANLSGMLYLSPSGWLLLSVPNAVVRGVFAAMDEPGVELPLKDGRLEAHVTVMRPEELAAIGGADKVTERGKHFRYALGRLMSAVPAGWPDVGRVWFLKVHSPELMALRRSYGLSALPNGGKFAFHVTVGVRRKGVLAAGPMRKASADLAEDARELLAGFSEAELDGIRVMVHPRLGWAWLDVMDWGEGEIGDRLEAGLAKLVGTDNVRRVNEGATPSAAEGWVKVADDAAPAVLLVKRAEDDDGGRPFTVAVDLDGTLAEKAEPFDPDAIGPPRPHVVRWVRRLHEAGARVVVFTVRGDADQVKDWLTAHDVPFDFVNENPDQPEGASGKVIADAYIDDRAVNVDDLDEAGPGLLTAARGGGEGEGEGDDDGVLVIRQVTVVRAPDLASALRAGRVGTPA